MNDRKEAIDNLDKRCYVDAISNDFVDDIYFDMADTISVYVL